MRCLPLVVVGLFATTALAGCVGHPHREQLTDPWVEPGLWEASGALLEDPDVEIQESAAPAWHAAGPVRWSGLDATDLYRLSVSPPGDPAPFSILFAHPMEDHAAMRVCVTETTLPLSPEAWLLAWEVIQARTNLSDDGAELEAYYTGDHRFQRSGGRCQDVNASLTLEGLEPTDVDERPGFYHVTGDGFEATVIAPYRTILVGNEPFVDEEGKVTSWPAEHAAAISVDVLDRVTVRREYNAEKTHAFEGEDLAAFVTDLFGHVGLPPPADPSQIRWSPYASG